MKRIIAYIMLFACFFTIPAFADNSVNPEVDDNLIIAPEHGFGWKEDPNQVIPVPATTYFQWLKTDDSWHYTDLGSHHLYSYIMYNANDTRFVKAETYHKTTSGASLHGYSRARFETIFGVVHSGTDSDRQWGTGFSTATSLNAMEGGIACTYCGDDTTIN